MWMLRKTLNPVIKKSNRKIDLFLADIIRMYKKHKMTLALKDKKSDFIVSPYSEDNLKWMQNALDGIYAKPKEESKK